MSGPTYGSLFSGYGGLEMGVQSVLGGTTSWHSEIDPGAVRILEQRWPGVPNLGDITAVDWTSVPRVDVLVGGFPCPDVSQAGLRAGLRPGTRSGLWAHFATAIDHLRPRLVVAENVRGLLSAGAHSDLEPCPWCVGDVAGESPLRAHGAVLGDLADLGYDAAWYGMAASDVGAPHQRFRVFIVAWPAADVIGSFRGRVTRGRRSGSEDHRGGPAPDADRSGLVELGRVEPVERDAHGRRGADIAWGDYEPAVRRWEMITGRSAPAPTTVSPAWLRDRARRLAGEHPAPIGYRGSIRRFLAPAQRLNPVFVEWMMGLPEGHVTAVEGLSYSEMLKALGNGVVPLQAAAATAVLLQLAQRAMPRRRDTPIMTNLSRGVSVRYPAQSGGRTMPRIRA